MRHTIDSIIGKSGLTREDIISLLSAADPFMREAIRRAAHDILLANCGPDVYYRGLIEFSNECSNDCYYCGIRMSNDAVRRYSLTVHEIADAAEWCARQGYGSVVLQSGERTDPPFIELVEDAVRQIKARTISQELPRGVGITLSVGEQSDETYERFFRAGAHRYLLRIESSSPELYARMHPASQPFAKRVACLKTLKKTGYQVGTGVMIGLPGQTLDDLADDILFFRDMDVDMIGMGPYIPHRQTPMAQWPGQNSASAFDQTLIMIATARIVLKNVNIAATTALQALQPDGREQGLRFGANIVMPNVTPLRVRGDYQLYEGKPCLDESAEQCRGCLEGRIRSIGREIGYGKWGDSRHSSGGL